MTEELKAKVLAAFSGRQLATARPGVAAREVLREAGFRQLEQFPLASVSVLTPEVK